MNIFKNIDNNVYENKLDYPDYTLKKVNPIKYKDILMAYQEENEVCMKIFYNDLKSHISNILNKNLTERQFKPIFNEAWERGHSTGYKDVVIEAENLCNIIKLFI